MYDIFHNSFLLRPLFSQKGSNMRQKCEYSVNELHLFVVTSLVIHSENQRAVT